MTIDPSIYLDSVSLRDFVHQASSGPVPEEGDDLALAEAIRRGDAEAADRLVRIHLRDAVDEAIRHRGDVPVKKLIRQGVRGLIRAAYRYEPARDGAFRSYARDSMRREIQASMWRE